MTIPQYFGLTQEEFDNLTDQVGEILNETEDYVETLKRMGPGRAAGVISRDKATAYILGVLKGEEIVMDYIEEICPSAAEAVKGRLYEAA